MNTLSGIFTERGLMDYLNLSDAQMEAMRAAGLPCLRVNARLRFYKEASVVAWLEKFEDKHERQPRAYDVIDLTKERQ